MPLTSATVKNGKTTQLVHWNSKIHKKFSRRGKNQQESKANSLSMERNILFQDRRTVLKNNAIILTLEMLHFLTGFKLYFPKPITNAMLTELYLLEAKNFQINKVPADRSLLPKALLLLTNAELMSVSWLQAPNAVIVSPQAIKTTVYITKNPILQNTHMFCRWLISRNIYDC